MAHFDTADNILNSAALELGLIPSAVSNPFASTDPNILQLVALLNRVGKNLVRARDWTHLTRRYTFDTVDGTESYDLPADYARMKSQTHWNSSSQRPLGGPVTAAAWERLKVLTTSGVIIQPFRVFGNLLYLHPTPSSEESIFYEYISSRWVGSTAPPSLPDGVVTTAITDTLWFDEPLLVAGLKLAYARLHERETAHLQAEYDAAYSAAAEGDTPGQILSAATTDNVALLDERNLPDTGVGG